MTQEAWDLAFHCVPLALVDAEFAKAQRVLMRREWWVLQQAAAADPTGA